MITRTLQVVALVLGLFVVVGGVAAAMYPDTQSNSGPEGAGAARMVDDSIMADPFPDTPTTCTSNVIENGGFETGDFQHWGYWGSFYPPTSIDSDNPHSGTYAALVDPCDRLGGSHPGQGPQGNIAIYQQITVPAEGGTLSYWWMGGVYGYPPTLPRTSQSVHVTDTDGNILATVQETYGATEGYVNQTFDMAPFAGQTVRIQFMIEDSGEVLDHYYMYVDDVELLASGSGGNEPPEVGPITAPVDPVPVGSSIAASADFTDDCGGDTHTATWNWGDGTTSPGTVTEASGFGSVTGSHNYTEAGVYTIVLTVTDDLGESGTSQYQYVVAYDPDGSVTGGGWITSPPEAYRPDPTLTGRANFGFVSRYRQGRGVPDGETEFNFAIASMNFRSTSYDWLVVSGARAQYRGTGTINGAGSYRFILTAIDGQISGGGGTDKFRMKIWEAATNELVYDNQPGAPDDADPTTVIGGGSITVHRR